MGSSEGKFDVKILGEEPAWRITAGAESTVLNNTYECAWVRWIRTHIQRRVFVNGWQNVGCLQWADNLFTSRATIGFSVVHLYHGIMLLMFLGLLRALRKGHMISHNYKLTHYPTQRQRRRSVPIHVVYMYISKTFSINADTRYFSKYPSRCQWPRYSI